MVSLVEEQQRLTEKLGTLGFSQSHLEAMAKLTSEIEVLKRQKNVVILGHSYQTPDILFGVSDFIGDSYQLSKAAQEVSADIILFAGVVFMAETAKVLNPKKRVFVPSLEAGCSLADSITAEDVRRLKAQFPERPVVTYVNSSAEVKAESDVCCTSANAIKIVEAMEGDEVIFLPDRLMGKNLQNLTKKRLILWNGTCIVHEQFKAGQVGSLRRQHQGVKVITHSECAPEVVAEADFTGGTNDMLRYVERVKADSYALVTECGFTERAKVEYPDKKFVGLCSMCPFMKKNSLLNILETLQNLPVEREIFVEEEVRLKALKSLERMFKITDLSR